MSTTSKRPRPLPLGDDLGTTIDRMRAIAAQAGDARLTEGPVHPDHQLLDICAEIGYRRKLAEAAMDRCRAAPAAPWLCKTPSEAFEVRAARTAEEAASEKYTHLLRAAAKLKATTAAGLYAKAIAVRSSKTGASFLAMSLAEDMLACEGLRASLWPVGEA